jgi:hypothetical protein
MRNMRVGSRRGVRGCKKSAAPVVPHAGGYASLLHFGLFSAFNSSFVCVRCPRNSFATVPSFHSCKGLQSTKSQPILCSPPPLPPNPAALAQCVTPGRDGCCSPGLQRPPPTYTRALLIIFEQICQFKGCGVVVFKSHERRR